MNIAARVKDIIREQLCLNEVYSVEVTDDAMFVEDLETDSLDAVELAIGMEEEFSIEIDDAELEPIKSVKDLVALVERKVGAF